MEKRGAPRPERRFRVRPGAASGQQAGTLDDIRRLIGVDAKPLAKVLPEAITQAEEERGPALTAALEPPITRTIRLMASRESQWFGEILAPTIGSAVRKAVADAFAALMQRFNEALERSMSLRSLQWRLEARRTGTSFAEVVLLRTLVYRVEQVFLIHSESGLVLQHVVAEGARSADPDQVASMLSAIDSFGREAFEPTLPSAYLHEFRLGDVTVWTDKGALATVAMVVRGVAPRALLSMLVETRERILVQQHANLANFVADVTPFVAARPVLEECLQEQRTKAASRAPAFLAVLAAIIVAALAALLVSGHVRHEAQERRLAAHRQTLEAEPGIVVTSASRHGNHFRLSGFRDPAAASAAEIRTRLGDPRVDLELVPFYSLDPRIIEERFRRSSAAPSSVAIDVSGGTLRLSGEARRGWIEQALVLARVTPGIERVESNVTDTSPGELAEVIHSLEAAEVRFAPRSSRLAPEFVPVIEQTAKDIESFRVLSNEVGLEGCVVVVADASPRGPTQLRAKLAAERAATVLGALSWSDPRLGSDVVQARGRSVFAPGRHTPSARFEVHSGPSSQAACRKGSYE